MTAGRIPWPGRETSPAAAALWLIASNSRYGLDTHILACHAPWAVAEKVCRHGVQSQQKYGHRMHHRANKHTCLRLRAWRRYACPTAQTVKITHTGLPRCPSRCSESIYIQIHRHTHTQHTHTHAQAMSCSAGSGDVTWSFRFCRTGSIPFTVCVGKTSVLTFSSFSSEQLGKAIIQWSMGLHKEFHVLPRYETEKFLHVKLLKIFSACWASSEPHYFQVLTPLGSPGGVDSSINY